MTEDQLERLGEAADHAVWHTPRAAKGYWSKDYYTYPDAAENQRAEMISIGKQIIAAIENITKGL